MNIVPFWAAINQVANEIKFDFNLLGVTANEDKLLLKNILFLGSFML